MPLLGEDFPRPLRKSVAILAPGLIGGSLGLALRARGEAYTVRIWARRTEAAAAAVETGAADSATTDLGECVAGASGIVFCTPVDAMPALAEAIRSAVRDDAAVTDAGSVKTGVVDALEAIFGGRFVGAHPIAGSERSGIDAASAGLFRGAPCILTPTPLTAPAALDFVRALWRDAGCRLAEMPPAEHDAILARTSHLPHAAAAALVHAVAAGNPDRQRWSGGGYRDATRVATGSPEMWAGILLANRECVLDALDAYRERLDALRECLEHRDANRLRAFLNFASEHRERLLNESDHAS